MRARYKCVCVKFREDDPAQMAAWEYLRANAKGTSYSAIIADAVAALEKKCTVADREDSRVDDARSKADATAREQMGRMEQMLMEVKMICAALRDDAGSSLPPVTGRPAERPVDEKPEEAYREDPFKQNVMNFAMRMGGEV